MIIIMCKRGSTCVRLLTRKKAYDRSCTPAGSPHRGKHFPYGKLQKSSAKRNSNFSNGIYRISKINSK